MNGGTQTAGSDAGTHHPQWTAPRRLRVLIAVLVVPMILATGVALVLLWPPSQRGAYGGDDTDRLRATVLEVHERACGAGEQVETPTGIPSRRCGTATVRIEQGRDDGRVVVTDLPGGPGAPAVTVGAGVLVLELIDPDDPTTSAYSIVDRQRGAPLLWLAILAGAMIVGFARWRGLAALAGLGVSFAVLLLFVLPGIAAGKSPLLVAVVGAAAIMFAVLYLTHGISVRTSIAVLGTLASLVLTGFLGEAAIGAAHLTGHGNEQATTLAVYFADIDIFGLLLAGIIIGSLGVLDDVTVTQTATVAELANANPGLSRRQLYRAAARVGRAHIASVVNTIVLAYAGASLPVILMIAGSGRPLGTTLTTEFAAEEIVRSLVATIGLVAAVPLTTALAALVTAPHRSPDPDAGRSGPDPHLPRVRGDDDPWAQPAEDWAGALDDNMAGSRRAASASPEDPDVVADARDQQAEDRAADPLDGGHDAAGAQHQMHHGE